MNRFFLSILFLLPAYAYTQPAWQQQVNTKIDVQLDDKAHFLHGFERMEYINNSPDTLRFLYIHLWPNAYKNDHTPFAKGLDAAGNTSFYFSKPADRGYIDNDSLQFTIDGQTAEFYTTDDAPDIARLELVKPLLPGGKINIATPFRVKIPKVFSRMGHTGQAYFISQWFPKPAVYDQRGWHPISYMDQGEFFSEYGSYDVAITLPANYVLMATGNCMDEKENQWLDSLAAAPLPADNVTDDIMPESAAELKTIHYHEDNIHDFAWFADKRWIVRKDTVMSPGSDNMVTTWAAYLPSYKEIWAHANTYLKETIKHYGRWVGPYPYKTIKAVLGDMRAGGGMEYPTVTIIDKSAVSNFKTVVVHEAGHNWFYGMLGSNERDHAWMDEGMNTFHEKKTMHALAHDSASLDERIGGLNEYLVYYELATAHIDEVTDQTAGNFTKLDYGVDVYYKTTLMLQWLEKYMGAGNFEAGMQDYYEKWHYHHPYPEDFKVCMQRHTPKTINWFFDGALKTDKEIDFKVAHTHINGSNTEVKVINRTGVTVPVLIEAYQRDSMVAEAWSLPFTHDTTLTLPVTQWTDMRISNVIPDAKSANDDYRRRALFHRFGVRVKPVFGLNLTDRDKLFIAPALGYNQYDGFMLGLLFHNFTAPQDNFRFALAPMYAFQSNSLVGTGSAGYIWYPDNIFKELLLQGDAKTFNGDETTINVPAAQYSRYVKLAPSIAFTFNEHNPLSAVTRMLTLKGYSISEQNFSYGTDSLAKPRLLTQQKVYGLLRYQHANDRTYNPFSYSAEGQLGADFAKINVEGNIRIDYNVKNKSLYVRGYLGKFFPVNSDPAVYSRYELNSTYSGIDDYLYDGTYIGRNEGSRLGAQQVSIQEGGFKIPVYNGVGRSDNWMAAINLQTDLPLRKLPVRLFFDGGLIPNINPGIENSGSSTFLYDGGVAIHLLADIINIYVPVIMSSDYQNYLNNNYGRKNTFARSLSFTIQLQNINWLKTPARLFNKIVN